MSDKILFKLQVFEGPLDLLLHLVKKNKVSIYDIPIVEITDQYIEYIQTAAEFDLELSSEFTVMAAQLIYLKSKFLLPKHEDENQEDERLFLVDRLIEYSRIKRAREELRVLQFAGSFSYYKEAESIKGIDPKPKIESIDITKLTEAFLVVLQKQIRKEPPPINKFEGIIGKEIVPVNTKINHIVKMVKQGRIKFEKVFAGVKSKSEAVSSFLAILELLRTGVLEVIEFGHQIYIEGKNLNKSKIDQAMDVDYA